MAAAPRVWVEVNLARLVENYHAIGRMVAPLDVMPVLKANAYGLGCEPIARALAAAGAPCFGVAEVREAIPLLQLGRPVHILGAILAEEVELMVATALVAPVGDFSTAQALSAEACRQGTVARAHILIDSGMGRLGIPLAQAQETICRIADLPNLRLEGLYSHFPYAYGDAAFSCEQIASVARLLRRLAAGGISFSAIHIANSDGVNNIAASCAEPFTMVRTGINLYGAFDLEGRRRLALSPVLTLKSRLVQIRRLPAGSTIGYGCSHVLPTDTCVGTVAVGYADGFPLALSNRGYVLIRGRRCLVLGRVSMDYITVSLEAVPESQVGDEVVCLGEGIAIAEWAEARNTIAYDVICSFGNRVVRTYV